MSAVGVPLISGRTRCARPRACLFEATFVGRPGIFVGWKELGRYFPSHSLAPYYVSLTRLIKILSPFPSIAPQSDGRPIGARVDTLAPSVAISQPNIDVALSPSSALGAQPPNS